MVFFETAYNCEFKISIPSPIQKKCIALGYCLSLNYPYLYVLIQTMIGRYDANELFNSVF